MNRLQNLLATPSESASTTTSPKLDSSSNHAYFDPLHYESNYAYPLIVWLHGPEGNQHQLAKIMPLISLRNFVAAAPCGTKAEDPDESRGFRWSQERDHVVRGEQRIIDCISRSRERFNVAADRVFLAGFDCGGTMALRFAMDHPNRVAGALSLGGRFPRGPMTLSRLDECRGVPVFLATGRNSRVYTESHVCHDLRLMYTAGMSVTLRQYPAGCEVTTQMLADMNVWMMELVCGVTSQ